MKQCKIKPADRTFLFLSECRCKAFFSLGEEGAKDIVKVSDEKYDSDRIDIIRNFLNLFEVTIIDYTIRVMEKDNILGFYTDISPRNLDEDFISVLESLKDYEEELTSEGKELKFPIEILCLLKN